MGVEIKDRKNRVEYLRCMLVIAGFNVTYQQTDLIMKIMRKFLIYGGNVDIKQITKIRYKWEKKREAYEISNIDVIAEEVDSGAKSHGVEYTEKDTSNDPKDD